MIQQAEARLNAMLKVLKTLNCVLEFHDCWKEAMPERLRAMTAEVIREEERMQAIDCGQDAHN